MDLDTLKTTIIGSSGLGVQFLSFLPEIVKLGVGIVTIVYLLYKIALIHKELKG
tara:strand:+ start:908 stop:1069 length:162 start_codon:yes stop_codon:yes gene_type:complete